MINVLTNQDSEFYPLVGPFLSKRSIVKELGFPVWDDPGKEWHVDVSDGVVRGLAALIRRTRDVLFCSAYVLPEFRRMGIYGNLLRSRLERVPGWIPISATATEDSRKALLAAGFIGVGSVGKAYQRMERRPANGVA